MKLRCGIWVLLVLSTVLIGCRRGTTQDEPPATDVNEVEKRKPPVPMDIGKGPIFVDVAAEAGLDFVHFIGATGEYYFPEIMAGGCALFDYDNDGDLDVYLLQGALLGPGKKKDDSIFPTPDDWPPRNRLYRNDLLSEGKRSQGLSFVDVTEESGVGDTGYGIGCAIGDYDNDGWLDLYVTNYGSNVLYRNNGDGTFSDVTAAAGVGDPRWGTSAAFVDYDRDGYLDLFVVNYVDATMANNVTCNPFGHRDYCNPNVFNPVMDVLYRNNGDGTFEEVTRKAGIDAAWGSGLGVVCADFNGDAWTDVYVANDGNENQLWINKGDGTFEDTALFSGTAVNADGQPEAGMGVAAGDVDLDGDMDIFVTHLIGQTNTMYRNTGDGFFEDATFAFRLGFVSRPSTGFGTGWFDYDNDGLDDLFCANGAVRLEDEVAGGLYPYQQKNQLFHNEGDQGFTDAGGIAGAVLDLMEVSRGAAFGDVDNDGDVDILVSNNNGPVRLLRNELGATNHWLSVALWRDDGNRFAVGARVTVVRTDGSRITKRVHTDGSYCSAGDLRVHFGLAGNASIRGVEVRWPNRKTEWWENLPIDQHVKLVQGSGSSKRAAE